MGVTRFLIYPPELLNDWPEVYRAYISGAEGRVFATRVEIDGNVMACRRQTSDSGKLHVAWPLPEQGRPVLSTTTLAEREQPYLLSLELARGKVSQVRGQLGIWETVGLSPPDSFRQAHKEAHQLLAKASGLQETPMVACELAAQAIVKACEAADILTRGYATHRLETLRGRMVRNPASLGCNLGDTIPAEDLQSEFVRAFDSTGVPVEWRLIEPVEGQYHWETNDAQVAWCEQNRLLMRGGPLLDFGPDGLPPWLAKWERDPLSMQSFMCDFVETAMSRYLSRIRIWEIAARPNSGGVLTLNEECRLAFTARLLEIARQVDDEAKLLIRIDQPWGDYQARGQHRLSPLQFVDALVRSGVGLSGVDLEIGVGYRPRGCAARDLMEFSRLIDLWSCLGISLHVTLAFPSASGADERACSDLEVDPAPFTAMPSESIQAEWINLYVPLLMAKESVAGVYWTHYADSSLHYFPHAGLVREDGQPKAALHRLAAYGPAFWQDQQPGARSDNAS